MKVERKQPTNKDVRYSWKATTTNDNGWLTEVNTEGRCIVRVSFPSFWDRRASLAPSVPVSSSRSSVSLLSVTELSLLRRILQSCDCWRCDGAFSCSRFTEQRVNSFQDSPVQLFVNMIRLHAHLMNEPPAPVFHPRSVSPSPLLRLQSLCTLPLPPFSSFMTPFLTPTSSSIHPFLHFYRLLSHTFYSFHFQCCDN